ncbi:tumor necrosis factor receptor superfamily member 6 isoform X2 [Notamacropus eugenii]|uniref:tumor necrosis factor receptor superfamily member 6 isoform X2 n=1 Tax=Notamacropus eugenii TaxID=9315 RepID=UPI003B67F831
MGGCSRPEVPLLLLLLIGIDGTLCRNIMSPWLDIDSKWPQVKKNFTKREATCPIDHHRVGDICCQLCPSGTKKTLDCTEDRGKPSCTNCTAGEEYTDRPHYYDKCLRCGLCDGEHGLEVRKNCTMAHNVVCGCAKHFFCNTPECKHCEPCTQCEHGVLEECTENRNAICQVQVWRRKHKANSHTSDRRNEEDIPLNHRATLWQRQNSNPGLPHSEASFSSTEPCCYSDIDLNKYIPKIAEKMELDQVKKFVRKVGLDEVKIDGVKHNYISDSEEQKFQLLRLWYENHGKKGAYAQLMSGLREIGLRVVAEELQEVIKTPPENEHENGNPNVLHNQGLASS